ncbi:MAG: FAD binding domain-containing protein [Oliverpabstia sp.]
MKNYVQASSLEEAYALRKKSKKNNILGGNLWMKMGSRNMMTGIDLCNLGLDRIEENEEEYRIGCMCSLRDLEVNESLQKEFGGSFKDALRHIVGVQFRNTATVGGSVFPRFGFSDVLTIFAALDSYVELYHGGLVPVKEFIAMKPDDDILVNMVVKKDGRKVSYQSHRMTETDFAVLTCAASCMDGKYTVALGATPHKAQIVDNVELADPSSEDEVAVFAESVVKQVRFGSNMRGSAEYRKEIAKVLIKRAVIELNK